MTKIITKKKSPSFLFHSPFLSFHNDPFPFRLHYNFRFAWVLSENNFKRIIQSSRFAYVKKKLGLKRQRVMSLQSASIDSLTNQRFFLKTALSSSRDKSHLSKQVSSYCTLQTKAIFIRSFTSTSYTVAFNYV